MVLNHNLYYKTNKSWIQLIGKVSEPQHIDSFDPPPSSNIEMPIHVKELKRRKRNILTPIFSYITGLASQDELGKVYCNEQQISLAENSLVDRIQAIQSQTTTIVDSIKEQNAKAQEKFRETLTPEEKQEIKL